METIFDTNWTNIILQYNPELEFNFTEFEIAFNAITDVQRINHISKHYYITLPVIFTTTVIIVIIAIVIYCKRKANKTNNGNETANINITIAERNVQEIAREIIDSNAQRANNSETSI
jgi:hypothetical protein